MNKPTLTKELIDAIRAEIFRKPEWEAVAEEMQRLRYGKRRTMHRISRYYFYEERTKAQGMNGRPFYSIIENDEDFRRVYDLAWRYLSCDYDEAKPVESMAAMMGGFGRLFRAYHIPSMFPFKRAREIMERYNTNGKVFDYSCGWGNRLCAALSQGLDYYGVDTNPDLVEILKRFAEDFNTTTGQATPHEIRCQGSEKFIPEYQGRFGLCFSSPPYFDMELYRGDQSCTRHGDYQTWLDRYLKPTIENCVAYLAAGGYFVCNIKNSAYLKLSMYDDAFRICEMCGLQFVCDEPLKVAKRSGCRDQKSRAADHANESMMVFRKSPLPHENEKCDGQTQRGDLLSIAPKTQQP